MLDPADLAAAPDPYPLLASARAQGTIAPMVGGFVAVLGHGAATEILRHPGCGTAPIAARYLDGLPDGAARDELGHRINFLDPPDHPRVRGLVNKAFTPRRIGDLRPWIASTADDLAAEIDPTTPFDLLDRYAHHVPSLVISELLGVPIEDRDHLTGLSDEVAPLLGISPTAEEREAAVAAAEEMHARLGALLEERLRVPGDDLLSALAHASEDGERLRRSELLSLAATLYSAGHRTTRDLFTNGMATLLAEPERWQHVVEGDWPIPAVVAEWLRFETPTQFVARIPYEDVLVDGHEVAAWTPALVFLGAANRDPAAYDEPDTFRPGREGPPSLSFAFGAHYCLGASLARSEAEAMLEVAVRHWPGLRLADADVRWHQRGPFRGVDELVVDAA